MSRTHFLNRDKIISCTTDKPVMLRVSEIDVELPSTESIEETSFWLDSNSAVFVNHNAIPELKSMRACTLSAFNSWARLMIIFEEIIHNFYSLKARRELMAAAAVGSGEGGGGGGPGEQQGQSQPTSTLEDKYRRILDSLARWDERLPPQSQIRWQGFFPGQHRKGGSYGARPPHESPHRGVGPHVLTIRAYASLCMLALHRPFIPHTGNNGLANQSFCELSSALSQPAQACLAAANEIVELIDAYEANFPVRKLSSGWVFLLFQAATIFCSFGASNVSLAHEMLKPNPSDIKGTSVDNGSASGHTDVRKTQQQRQQMYEITNYCHFQLERCIDRLGRISHTHKSAERHVDILRNLTTMRSNLNAMVSQTATTSASTSVPSQPLPSYSGDMQRQPGSQYDGSFEQLHHPSPHQQHHQQQHEHQQHSSHHPPTSPQHPLSTATPAAIEGVSDFWSNMPLCQNWDSWNSYFDHLYPVVHP